MQEAAKEGYEPELPAVEAGGYLYEAWKAMGCCCPGPMPFPWSEVAAFGQVNGFDQSEMQILRDMSAGYVEGLRRGMHPLGIAPFTAE